jgi:hypothetical protein
MITIEEIEKAVKRHMKNNIQSVIEGDQDSVQLFFVRPGDIVEYIEELGGWFNDDIDVNGWSWDYNFKVELSDEHGENPQTFSVSGDGFYSNSALFQKEK